MKGFAIAQRQTVNFSVADGFALIIVGPRLYNVGFFFLFLRLVLFKRFFGRTEARPIALILKTGMRKLRLGCITYPALTAHLIESDLRILPAFTPIAEKNEVLLLFVLPVFHDRLHDRRIVRDTVISDLRQFCPGAPLFHRKLLFQLFLTQG